MAQPSMVIRIAANVAELKKNLAEGKVQIETTTAAMSKLANSLSGAPLFQAAMNITAAVNAAGGATKLTRAEMDRHNVTLEKALDKYRALGQEAPAAMVALAEATKKITPELNNATTSGDKLSGVLSKASGLLAAFGVGLGVGTLVSFGSNLLEMAGTISDLSVSTGVSTTALQKFAYVGAGAGVSMDEIGRSVGTLSERLAGGDQSAMDAVQKLGLSIDGLLKAGPEEAFVQIGEAVGRMEDPMQRNAVAADLFGGKLSKQLIPILGDLRQAMEDVPKVAVISDDTIQRIDDLGDAWDRAKLKMMGFIATNINFDGRDRGMTRTTMELMRGVEAANAEMNARARDIGLMPTPPELPAGFVQGYQQGADAVDDLHAAFKKFKDETAEAAKKKLVELEDKVNDLQQTTAKGLWVPKASDMSDALDGYIADLKAAASQVDRISGIESGGVKGVWNIGVQLDTKDAQAGLQRLQEQAKASLGGLLGSIVQGMPKTLQQAFSGGGGLKGFGQSITSQVGEALGSKLFVAGGPMNGMGNKLAGIFGSSFGLALPGIGTALGALVGPIMGKLFSVLQGIGGP
ncbi:MAG: hypothetical protein ACKVOG_03240, partial [Rhodoglobus sp.]